MESVGFKEWAIVCQALGRGEQSVLLRKGGIAEGRHCFSFKHAAFFLFPTFFHEETTKVRATLAELPAEGGDSVLMRYFARLERTVRITSLATAEKLASWHILTAEVVRERFRSVPEGLDIALVRIFTLTEPWKIPNEKRFGGCRSWVDLPAPPTGVQLHPVLDHATHARKVAEFDRAIAVAA